MSISTMYGGGDDSSPQRKTFFNHVFSTTEEGKADMLNIFQYAFLGFIPVLMLYHLTQYLIPDVNTEKSSIEIIIEIVGQLVLMFGGMIIIHRAVTYVPTYSEFKYDSLSLTSIGLISLFLMLSIRTKLGVKATILYDRAMEMWHGPSSTTSKKKGASQQDRAGYIMQPAMSSDSIIPAMNPPAMSGGSLPNYEPQPASAFGGVFGAFK